MKVRHSYTPACWLAWNKWKSVEKLVIISHLITCDNATGGKKTDLIAQTLTLASLMSNKKYIIYGVLNWGLGHATRSVAVINALLQEGFKPVIASDGLALNYLKMEFPGLETEELPSYNVTYGKGSFIPGMLKKLPGIAGAIAKEQRQLGRLLRKYEACGVISDNRLGFYSRKVPSVYITHQLEMDLPLLFSMANYVHRSFIEKYTECWIPDLPGSRLSGKLSGSGRLNCNKRYVGPLSRFTRSEACHTEKYDILVILSGPEPQRTFLENRIIGQLNDMKGRFMLVRGVDEELKGDWNFEWKGLAESRELKDLTSRADMIVSRSGYSSLMDYYFLGKKALLIPTPGQAEQEYLADYHTRRKVFYSVSQEDLNLGLDIEKARRYSGFSVEDQFKPNWKELFGLFEGK